jgi:cytochrome P450
VPVGSARASGEGLEVLATPPAEPVSAPARHIDQLPGPRGLPLFGNLLQLDSRRLHRVLEGWAREFGSLYVFRAGPKRTVVVSDPAQLEQILRARPEHYRRIGQIERVFAELGMPGVFSAEGAAWRPQRRLITAAMSARAATAFYPKLLMLLERLRRRWQVASKNGTSLDVLAELKRLTVDATMLLSFGRDANTIEHDRDEIRQQLSLIFPALNRRMTAAFPYWRIVRSPADRRVDRAIQELRKRLRQLLDEARRRLAEDPSQVDVRTDLLSAMLLARDEAGQPFSDDLILGNAQQMLLGGEDTTAATLAWAVHVLCERPDLVAWMREELDSIVGASGLIDDAERSNQLVRTDAIVQETLRLRSAAPIIFLESAEDVSIDGVAVPRGTWVIALTRLASMSAEHNARPLDFVPERWLDSASGPRTNPRVDLPFGSGARICPGRTLALIEMRVALAMLFSTFDVERVGRAEQVGERFAFIVEPVGLEVRLRPRAR